MEQERKNMKPWTKAGIKAGLLTFVIVLPINLSIHEICVTRDAERTIQPTPVESKATTAREEIVTGVCTFGDCPVATTACTTATTVCDLGKVEEVVVAKNTATEEFSVAVKESFTTELVSDTYTFAEPATERNGYIGTMWITGYTAGEGFPEGSATASGYGVRSGYCAMNDSQRRSLGISYGDRIYVDGLGTYTVMDSGCGWGVVDIWVQTNAEAYRITGYREVYLG